MAPSDPGCLGCRLYGTPCPRVCIGPNDLLIASKIGPSEGILLLSFWCTGLRLPFSSHFHALWFAGSDEARCHTVGCLRVWGVREGSLRGIEALCPIACEELDPVSNPTGGRGSWSFPVSCEMSPAPGETLTVALRVSDLAMTGFLTYRPGKMASVVSDH